MIVSNAVNKTLDYYLEELARGEVGVQEAKRRILESLERQDFIIEHRENVAFRAETA